MEEEEAGKDEPSLLELLRKSNQELEKMLRLLGEQDWEIVMLKKLYPREFGKPFSTILLIHYLNIFIMCTLYLKNGNGEIPPIVALNSIKDLSST